MSPGEKGPQNRWKSLLITEWSPGETNRPELISIRSHRRKVTLLWLKWSLICWYPKQTFAVCCHRNDSLPPPLLHIRGAEPSAGCLQAGRRFRWDFFWKCRLSPDTSGLNPGHERKVWWHEQHIKIREEGSASRRGGGGDYRFCSWKIKSQLIL